MTLITVPTFLKSVMESASLRLSQTDFAMRSAFTRQRQVLSWPSGHMWLASCTVPSLVEPQAGQMRSFLSKLSGRANTFQFPVPAYAGPQSGYSGSAGVVKGADQTGYTLATDGWTPSTLILSEGDFITVNEELKIAASDVNSDGSGEATITVTTPWRNSPSDNDPIELAAPYALMSLADSDGAGWDLSAPRFSSFQLNFEEAVDL